MPEADLGSTEIWRERERERVSERERKRDDIHLQLRLLHCEVMD